MSLKHAKLSASGSARWLNCAGSVKAEDGIKDRSSSAAEEGTCAHELGELMLKSCDDTIDWPIYIGKTLNDAPDVPVDAEMVRYASDYAEYCRSLMTETSVMFVEERVDFSEWVPDGFGTGDCIIIDDAGVAREGVAHCIDLKYGKGIPVYAENNTQAMLYALGVLSDYSMLYDIKRFVLHIYQPRINNISEWEITTEDLLEWAEWVKERAQLCLTDDAPRTPGDEQCAWCKAKPTCKPLREHVEKTINAQFDDLELEDPKLCDIGNVLKNKKLIESYLKAVEQHAQQLMLDGESIEGFKLVAGRSNRRWANEKDATKALVEHLGDNAFAPPKLLSVAQAEKAIGKDFKQLEPILVTKPDGSPTIAPIDDKRPAVNDVTDLFD